MRSQTEREMDLILKNIRKYLGWEMNHFLFDEKALQLQFSNGKDWVWFTFKLKQGNPYFFYSEGRVYLIKSKRKPIELFWKSHFKENKLVEILRDEALGRVIRFYFEENQQKFLEIVLVPGRVNVSFCDEKKNISAFKPKSLGYKFDKNLTITESVRDNVDFLNFWQEENLSKKTAQGESKDRKRDLKKKEKGLKKVEESLYVLKQDFWGKAGAWINSKQSFENLPQEYIQYIDQQQSLSWNINNCYSRSKKDKDKILGTLERIETLKSEIESIKSGKVQIKKSKEISLLKKAELKGKTYEVGGKRLFIGRSGGDNLKLLRRAKPWYIWIHIKDYPGAHGILEIEKKSEQVKSVVIEEAARRVVENSLPKGASGKFDCLYAECRYVRPIKGAKSGQVTYSHEKVIVIKVGE